jgi:homoserine kinase
MTTASAPASSANLGPGFDVLALALDLRCEVEAVDADEWSVTSNGRPVDEDTEAMVREVAGDGPKAVFIRSAIPESRGLGSSASVRVATAAAVAGGGGGPVDREHLLRVVSAAEGHADNAAAAVYGGLVFVDATGAVHRLGVHPSIVVVIAVPSVTLATDEARAALPDSVPRALAVRTSARVAGLIEGLRTAEPAALAAARGDEMHEAPRAALAPVTTRLVEEALGAGALHAAWSGAGPSAIAFVTEKGRRAVRSAFEEVLEGAGEVLEPAIDRSGVAVEK